MNNKKPNHWGDLEEARQLAINRITAILADPTSSPRLVTQAARTLATLNRQNMDVDGPGDTDNELVVTMREA